MVLFALFFRRLFPAALFEPFDHRTAKAIGYHHTSLADSLRDGCQTSLLSYESGV